MTILDFKKPIEHKEIYSRKDGFDLSQLADKILKGNFDVSRGVNVYIKSTNGVNPNTKNKDHTTPLRAVIANWQANDLHK